MSYSIQVLSVRLQRSDNTVSWGFNVQGGKEFHSPLVIQKVIIIIIQYGRLRHVIYSFIKSSHEFINIL